jgi:hypothetical protein
MLFILTPLEYEQALGSSKFKQVTKEGIIPYPDGSPGFYLARLAYADRVEEIFAAEKEARRQLVKSQVSMHGEQVTLRYSQIDMGAPELMFDDDHFTLMRGLEANPFILELDFLQPRQVSGLETDFGLMDVVLNVTLYPAGGDSAQSYSLIRQRVTDARVEMKFDHPPALVSRMRVEILNPLSGDRANIHIRELMILP